MSEIPKLANAPIVEAVVDIDCDMPPDFDLIALQQACRDRFRDRYPKFRQQLVQEHRIQAQSDAPPSMSVRHAIQAFHLVQEDDKQLVQVRAQGFSFNRLSPYGTLDEYLPEIERAWHVFVDVAAPVQVRVVRLRYINRILIPLSDGKIALGDYFKISPQLPPESNLNFVGFLNQHVALEEGTGHEANIVLTAQPPENEKLPIIFDICVAAAGAAEPGDWSWILEKIQSLRRLKNRIFKNTLTQRCLNLFQP